jgi:hypothetical protein
MPMIVARSHMACAVDRAGPGCAHLVLVVALQRDASGKRLLATMNLGDAFKQR